VAVTRKRSIPFVGGGPGVLKQYTRRSSGFPESIWNTVKDPPLRPSHLQGTQVTVSESHPEWRRKNRPDGDVGGNFTTTRQYAFSPIGNVQADTGWYDASLNAQGRDIYSGPCCLSQLAVPSQSPFPPFAMSSDNALNAFGSTAIAKCAPARPTASLAVALLEAYHDGLPKMIGRSTWETRTQKAINLRREAGTGGDEFLNYQFGILPLVSDVQDFVKAVVRMDKLLQQYIRDNGKMVRRRFTFTPEESTVETVVDNNATFYLGTNSAQFFNLSAQPRAQVVRTRQSTVHRWFLGAFVYHLPQTFFAEMYLPFAADFQVMRKILGLDLTPEVLWELTPWSWAVDWFSNVGDVIHNASAWANDGLVLKYGYIMEHSIVSDTYTYVGPSNLVNRSSAIRPPVLKLVSEAKIRRAANPFGFGLTMDSLSFVQKSILAALGLTRLR
jgi:hypothetical protein